MSIERIAAWGGSAVVALAVAAGLIVLGTPGSERERRLDARRIADLERLALTLRTAYAREGALPATLEPLVDGLVLDRLPRDPRTDAPYPYRVEGEGRFTLCATFDGPSEAPQGGFWTHGAGSRCFSFDAERATSMPPGTQPRPPAPP